MFEYRQGQADPCDRPHDAQQVCFDISMPYYQTDRLQKGGSGGQDLEQVCFVCQIMPAILVQESPNAINARHGRL